MLWLWIVCRHNSEVEFDFRYASRTENVGPSFFSNTFHQRRR